MITNEPELTSALRALRAAGPLEPPPEIEQRLLQAFRQKQRLRKRAAWAGGSMAAGVAAAGLAVLLWIPAPPAGPEAYVIHAPPPELAVEVPHAKKPVAKVVAKRVIPRVPPKTSPVDIPEVATKFYELPDADIFAPVEDATVVRVQLPRSAMRLIGLPVNEERAAERIRADVVLGQDGIARAVRFIQ